jgi:hypothetical protein
VKSLCVVLTALLPLSAFAGPDWNKSVQQLRDQFTRSRNDPKPCVYPALAGRVDGLFRRYPIIHIVIHGSSDDGRPNTTDLYISEKEVCVSQSNEGWNLYADADHVFEWEQGGSSAFLAGDLVNLPELVTKLETHSDPLSHYLWEHLSAQTRRVLTDPNAIKQQQQSALIAALNEILLDGSLYDSQRFAGVQLSPRTLALKAHFSQGVSTVLLNRLLLEDAYPLELKRNPQAQQEGIRTKRDNEELISYLYYLTDPSWIMAGFYSDYMAHPAAFTCVDHGGGQSDFYLKQPAYGFVAFFASEKPLWFLGLRCKDEKTGVVSEFQISEPEEAKEIPALIKDEVKTIHFEDSTLSLDRLMTFL